MLQKARKKHPGTTLEEIRSRYGSRYRQVLAEVREVLENLEEHFPTYGGQGYEIAGFFWHQGWNDGCSKELSAEYEANMTHFIRDMRRDLGDEALPFVIATSGMGGPDATGVAGWLGESIEPQQIRAAEKFARCVAVPTRHFQRHKPGRQKSHWHNSAESYCLVGDAAARAMLEILKAE
jgi:alpha-galactosidase